MSDNGLFTYKIESNDAEIDNTYKVLSIRVERQINKIATAEIVLKDGQPSEQTFEITDSDTFKPGASIEIKFGYDGLNQSIFKGLVTRQNISTTGDGTSLTVHCKDEWVKSTVGAKMAAFESATSSAIIEKIVENYAPLTAEVSATSFKNPELVQYKTIDWDMMLNLAEKEGMVLITDSGNLVVAKPDVSTTPEVEIKFGSEAWDFSVELDASYQASSLKGAVWDIENQQAVEVTAKEPTVNEQGNLSGSDLASALGLKEQSIVSATALSQDGIQNWADASLLKMRMSGYTGRVSFKGDSDVKANSQIKLSGFGDRFNGAAYVSGVIHSTDGSKWKTEVILGLNPKWGSEKADVRSPETVSSIPAYQGIQVGVVKAIVNDPDNNFRVQVQIPFLNANDQMIWARLASYYTGNTFGSFFMPEIDSEVILAFVNNDPSSPVILGSLFSSKIPAPLTPAEDVDIKMLKTKSGLEISFDDSDGKVILSMKTPQGNSIVMSEEESAITITDQNENEIKMTGDSISVNSQAKLEIKAADELTIDATKITITGSSEVNVSGGKISASSDGTCDLSATGAMSVSGSAVNLN